MIKSEKGAAFLMVTITISIMMIMMGMLLTLSATDIKISNTYADGVKAYSLAESGVYKAMSQALSNQEQSFDEIVEQNIFASEYTKAHSITWKIEYDSTSEYYTLTCTGAIGKSSRTIRAIIMITDDNGINLLDWKQI